MTGASGEAGRLRVVTWNIRAAIGPGEPFPPAWWRHVRADRLAAIGAFIASLDPDVVTLQEVAILTVNGNVSDQSAELARLTGLRARYGAVHSFPLVEPEAGAVVGSAMWGHALLTRDPLAESFTRGLPQAADDDVVEPAGADHDLAGVRYADTEPGHREARCVVGGWVDSASALVATTHLTYIGREQRAMQAEAARAIVDGVADGRPLVLTGDFNAAVDATELRPALDGLVDGFTAMGLETGDAARESCGTQSIDHILARGLRFASCRVAREAAELSDHWPVVADLEPADGGPPVDRATAAGS
ncbi:MAG TPA: endonuclease/exonuclease/phosphatase family protein [Candidatus Limnocylindrales bacterium]|nr:endonuclease/exonuclease/phosphatase family protein [Candidatus Limnocylindrales bacterium]